MRRLARVITFFALAMTQLVFAGEQEDFAALRALDQAYATEWIDGDADGVMALFTEDATIVPHHGDAPIKGREAIRNFWFNPDYPPTAVPEWRREATEIFVSGDMGVVRGRSRLVWEYDGTRTTIPEGNYVIVARRGEKAWRIRLLTFNDDPRKWIQEPVESSKDQAATVLRSGFQAPIKSTENSVSEDKTMSASANSGLSAAAESGTAMTRAPAALAARTPDTESSSAKQSCGRTPSKDIVVW